MALTPEQINEGNRLIAEFDGWELSISGRHYRKFEYHGDMEVLKDQVLSDKLKYHTSYDWIMPVVEQIHKLPYFAIHIDKHCVFIHTDEEICHRIDTTFNDSKVEIIFLAVVFFIKWYNQNKAQ